MQNVKSIFPGNKKGINDISIIAIILSIFFATATVIGFINNEFGTNFTEVNDAGIVQTAKNDAESVTALSAFTVLKNILLLALLDFQNILGLPFWLDLFYTILAIVFILVIARNIWIGGGA